MKNEYICDDRDITPEYIQHLWEMSESEFEKHIEELKKDEEGKHYAENELHSAFYAFLRRSTSARHSVALAMYRLHQAVELLENLAIEVTDGYNIAKKEGLQLFLSFLKRIITSPFYWIN